MHALISELDMQLYTKVNPTYPQVQLAILTKEFKKDIFYKPLISLTARMSDINCQVNSAKD